MLCGRVCCVSLCTEARVGVKVRISVRVREIELPVVSGSELVFGMVSAWIYVG